MTTKILFSSNQVDTVTIEQMKEIMERHQLGNVTRMTTSDKGAMGQTLFVETEEGKYVFKGNPLYPGQFDEELYYLENLANRTNLPLPTPYIVSKEVDITGWPYVIMPRLMGVHVTDASLNQKEHNEVMEDIADVLSEMHQWKSHIFGEYNPIKGSVEPFERSYFTWLKERVHHWLNDAKKYSVIEEEDVKFVESIFLEHQLSFEQLVIASYVMGDFKEDNFIIDNKSGHWKVSGVFDWTNGFFGDGVHDLAKLYIQLLRQEDYQSISTLLHSYSTKINQESIVVRSRLAVHVLHQCVLDWGCLKAMGKAHWEDSLSFRAWVEPILNKLKEI